MRPKILVLSLLFPNREHPDYGVFVFNRLRAIQAYCDISIVAPVPVFPFMERLAQYRKYRAVPRIEEVGPFRVYHPKFWMVPRYMKSIDSISYFLSSYRCIRKLSKAGRFDLIDVHWTYPDIFAAYVWSILLDKKFLVTVRGKEAFYLGECTFRKRILDMLLRRASAVIALSGELAQLTVEAGVDRQKVHVILNGVGTGSFAKLDQAECRRKLNLPTDRKIVLTVGSLIRSKGHLELIDAVASLPPELSAELYVIGGPGASGDDSSRIREQIRKLGLANVHLVGPRPNEELALWYNAADVFCLASMGEGCPNVVLEALACGTPVVASDVGAVREIVRPDESGIIVAVGDRDQLAAAVRDSLTKVWDRDRISRTMGDRTWDACAREVIRVYEHVLRRPIPVADRLSEAG